MYAKYVVTKSNIKGSYIVVRDGKVSGYTSHGTAACLSNFAFMLDGGYSEKRQAVKEAAIKGVNDLSKITQLSWK